MLDFLTPDELAALTGKRTHAAQGRALKSMKIPAVARPDGQWLVLRSTVAALFKAEAKTTTTRQPDFTVFAKG